MGALRQRWDNGKPCESNTCTAKGWDALVAKVKAAGMPVDDMRVVAVRIRSLGGIGHAILVVYQGSTAWVLDNRTPKVLDASLIKVEFQPVMSLNENQWWYHLPSK